MPTEGIVAAYTLVDVFVGVDDTVEGPQILREGVRSGGSGLRQAVRRGHAAYAMPLRRGPGLAGLCRAVIRAAFAVSARQPALSHPSCE